MGSVTHVTRRSARGVPSITKPVQRLRRGAKILAGASAQRSCEEADSIAVSAPRGRAVWAASRQFGQRRARLAHLG